MKNIAWAWALALSLFGLILTGCTGSGHTSPPVLPSASSLPSSCLAATAGANYSCDITVSNGNAPFTWTVTGLPAGLTSSVNADTTTLTISGVPQAQAAAARPKAPVRTATTADSSIMASVQITVTDKRVHSATLIFTITVTTTALSISTTSPLPGGTAGTAYSATVTASGGVAPYNWTITGLPAGLNSSFGTPSAAISGTTDVVGTFSVSAMVSDSAATPATASATLSLTISQAAALKVTTTSLPSGTVNTMYSQTVAATGGVAPYSWTVASGNLPTGLSLSSTGVISGKPTASGSFSFMVQASDAETPAQTATQSLSITINTSSGSLSITTSSPLPGATLNAHYSASVTATGGTPPYTWSLGASSVDPPGLSLTSGTPSASVSGTPTATGTFQFTLDVKDSAATPATASAAFLVTVTGSSTLNCPANINLTLCGTYELGLRGFNGSGAPLAGGVTFVADNSGHIISGIVGINQSVTGPVTKTITGGSYIMDSSGDGRGILTLIDSTAASTAYRFVLESSANPGVAPVIEFDNSGTLASGILVGPETPPVPQIPANTILALGLEGINGAGQRAGLLGDFQVGSGGCDGSAGSFNSLAGEKLVTNTSGTVDSNLTATGSCTASDPNTGIGSAQITISGGTPFTNTALHFEYVSVAAGSQLEAVFFLETDSIAANQPILSGLGGGVTVPSGGFNASSLGCPCLFVRSGTTDGTTAGHSVASIIRILTMPGAGASGTLTGVEDTNFGGTITLAGALGPYNYTLDANGVGTISAPSTIHFVITGDTMQTMDEGVSVLTGSFRPQNATTIQTAGAPYIVGLGNGDLVGVNRDVDNVVGVITPSGATSGTLTGTVDVINGSGSVVGASASGSYGTIDSTGRGTGSLKLTGSTNSVSIVIYARRVRQFVILDVQSTDPYQLGTRLQ